MPNENRKWKMENRKGHHTDNMADRREKMRLRLQEKLRKKHETDETDICPKCGGTEWGQAILLDDENLTAKAIDDAVCKSCKWLRKTDFDCPAEAQKIGVISVKSVR